MFTKTISFVILLFAISCETKKIKLPPSHPYLYNLELKFKEDKLNDYIVDSFFASNSQDGNNLVHCDITLLDLLKALPTKKITVTDFAKALEDISLLQDDDEVSAFITNLTYAELKAAGFSAEKVYKNIAKTYFKDRPEDLLQCLNLLGIAEEFSVAYTFGTDEDIFNAFHAGNYSYYNLAEIVNLIGAPSTLKELFNALGLKKLNELGASLINTQIAPALIQKGLTEEKLKSVLATLGLTVGNYKESKAFKACYSSLTRGNSLAVAVTQNELITNDDEILIKYLNLESYTSLVAKSFQGGLAYNIAPDDIKRNEADNIIRLKVNGALSNFIDQASADEDLSSILCDYVSVNYDQLIAQSVRPNFIAGELTVSKLYNTPFKKGSPLVCDGKLRGLASINKFSSIVFDYVQSRKEQEVPPPIENKPDVIYAIIEYFKNKYPNFNPCKFLQCGENKENSGNEETTNDEGADEESSYNTSPANSEASEEVTDKTEAGLSSEVSESDTESVQNEDNQIPSEDHTEGELEPTIEEGSGSNTETSSEETDVGNEDTTSEQADTAEQVEENNSQVNEDPLGEVTPPENSNVTPDVTDVSTVSDEEPVPAFTEVPEADVSLHDDNTGAEPVSEAEDGEAEDAQTPDVIVGEVKTSEEIGEPDGIVP